MCVDTKDMARSNSWKRTTVIGKRSGRVLLNPLKESSSSEEIIEGKSIHSRAVSVLALSQKAAYPDSKKDHISTIWITKVVGPIYLYLKKKGKKLLSSKTNLKCMRKTCNNFFRI
jgi:hypothetical protein